MYCFHPINVREWKENNDGTHSKTNRYHYVPCGKCVACLSRKRNEFTYRLQQEEAYANYSYFLTLTYDQNNVPIKLQDDKPYFVFNKKHVQDFLKRFRYYIAELNKEVKCSYFCISEYGGHTHRPHYHMLLFVKNDKFHKYRNVIERILDSQWKYGFTVIKPTNQANIHYCTKYCIKNLEELPADCIEPVFMLASKRPFLGAGALDTVEQQYAEFTGTERMDPYVFNNGCRNAMPRIYRQKLGLKGYGKAMSCDPRLTEEQYKDLLQKFPSSIDREDMQRRFAEFVNKQFKIKERAARLRQLQRSETL